MLEKNLFEGDLIIIKKMFNPLLQLDKESEDVYINKTEISYDAVTITGNSIRPLNKDLKTTLTTATKWVYQDIKVAEKYKWLHHHYFKTLAVYKYYDRSNYRIHTYGNNPVVSTTEETKKCVQEILNIEFVKLLDFGIEYGIAVQLPRI
ncbi:MAG: hypothetical protein KC414_10160 [Romboutsia sp.]|nr:hypothetical protein [Romboutsia sp.]